MPLVAGHRLGHYAIVAFIGEGGMGESTVRVTSACGATSP